MIRPSVPRVAYEVVVQLRLTVVMPRLLVPPLITNREAWLVEEGPAESVGLTLVAEALRNPPLLVIIPMEPELPLLVPAVIPHPISSDPWIVMVAPPPNVTMLLDVIARLPFTFITAAALVANSH